MVKNVKSLRLIAVILSAVFVACAVLAVVGITKNSGIDPMDARNSIVWVNEYLYDTQGAAIAAASGTGWVIGKPGDAAQYIVTNGHVVAEAYEYPKAYPDKCSGDVYVIFSAAENDYVSAQVVYYSPADEKDIAILRLPSPTNKRVPLSLRASDDVKVGETVYALGYPGVSSDKQSFTTFDTSDITVTKGIVSKRAAVAGVAYEAFQMDVYINHGNSGGPLVDEHGYAIGINTLGNYDTTSGQMTDMNYAIVADELIRVLNSEGISYAVKGESAWMIYVFGILALLAGAGAALLFMRSGKNAPSNGGTHKGKSPVLRGIGGIYAGQTFPLNTRLTLGRSAAVCQIVFPEGTPGISSEHCSVAYDQQSGSFILTDSGSSYGTFLSDGRKLAARVPERLNSGDVFYLADGVNRFAVGEE